jgi:hypothetical protein
MDSSKFSSISCPQCGTDLASNFSYCPVCGQKRIQAKESLKDIINNFLGDYFAFDSKIMTSLKPLVGKPGFLTLEYMAHRRVKYISPLRLYIFISILFFLVLNWGGAHNENAQMLSQSNEMDDFFRNYLPKIFFFFVPLFAAIMKLLFRKSKVTYVNQLVGALHFHAFVFLILSFYVLISAVFARFQMFSVNMALLGALVVWFFAYLFISMKRITGVSRFSLVWRFLVSLILYSLAVTLITIAFMGYFALNA